VNVRMSIGDTVGNIPGFIMLIKPDIIWTRFIQGEMNWLLTSRRVSFSELVSILSCQSSFCLCVYSPRYALTNVTKQDGDLIWRGPYAPLPKMGRLN